jgi:hypothetical protein
MDPRQASGDVDLDGDAGRGNARKRTAVKNGDRHGT